MSSGNIPDARATSEFRRSFPARWKRFLCEVFPTNTAASRKFNTDESAVRSWKAEATAPSGYVVAIAFRDYPVEAARFLLGGCLGRLIRRAGGFAHV